MLPSLNGVRRLGLLGGTFDPIHTGHLALAEHVRYHAGLDRVWFIPAAVPPHKDRGSIAPADTRLRMTVAAVEAFRPTFEAADLELRREGPSYTLDTLMSIRDAAGPDVELFWIVGRDNLAELPHWYQPERIANIARVVAGGRPGSPVPESLPQWFRSRLLLLEGPDVNVSSTSTREYIARGVIPADAIPEPVRRIIIAESLYEYPGQ